MSFILSGLNSLSSRSRRRKRAESAALCFVLLQLGSCVTPVHATIFELPPNGDDIVGRVQYVKAREEDTLADLARRYDVGYQEIVAANPGVDPWLPKPGTRIVLPTQYVLPDAPRYGIVLNVSEMRLYYYPVPKPDQPALVITYPVGIGREGWSTPLGSTTVVSKIAHPTWYPTDSVRREHMEDGDVLPDVVPPGPDNPLGEYALYLGLRKYLIHGTNKRYGVGMRVSHGCVRLYPEDIEYLFRAVPVNTPVRIVDQPYKTGWKDGVLFLESHRLPASGEKTSINLTPVMRTILETTRTQVVNVNWSRATEIASQNRGVPVAIYP